MPHINTIFNQLLRFVPRHHFDDSVKKYQSDRYVKKFDTWSQFITLLYSQITGADSLRDIETTLGALHSRWYHVGLKSVKRSTLSEANAKRDYRTYEDLFYALLGKCKNNTPKHKFNFTNPLYSMDATVIDLCLSVFPWAKFRKRKGALKLHIQYDHSGHIPAFMVVTDGKQHESKVAKLEAMHLMPDSIVSFDKAYIDYKWLCLLNKTGVYFVTRAKSNMRYGVTGQHTPPNESVLSDEKVRLKNNEIYKDEMRLVRYKDKETGKELVFMTNNFELSAETVAQIYKSRWQIELFFKWIKQNLKIKTFLGTSKNAVLTQIWVAMCYYLLLTYIKYQAKYAYSLLEFTRIISATLFERLDMIDILSCQLKTLGRVREPDRHPRLF